MEGAVVLLAVTLQDEDDFQWLALGVLATVLVVLVLIVGFLVYDRVAERREADRMERQLRKVTDPSEIASRPEIGTGPTKSRFGRG
jgi:Na+/melibiose symporter-like transporter